MAEMVSMQWMANDARRMLMSGYGPWSRPVAVQCGQSIAVARCDDDGGELLKLELPAACAMSVRGARAALRWALAEALGLD